MIDNIFTLHSFGSTRDSSAKCVAGNGVMDCCDMTNVSFDLPTDFFFGATGSAQGNTRNATIMIMLPESLALV